MRQLSPAGEQAVNTLAQRHGFSFDAVATMLDAVIAGNGGMAQFSHPEFGGSGQWMRGGMTMIGDMFNNSLKGRVDALCADLSALVAGQADLIRTGSFQSQSQGGYGQFQGSGGPAGSASLFVPAPQTGASGNWWGDDLAWPNSTGSQNNSRYAYFAQARRLAVEVNGTVTIYDTLDHAIGGFGQQQSQGGSLTFSSQYGVVDVASLPVVSVNGAPACAPPAPLPAAPQSGSTATTDVFAAIEKLAELHSRGILSDNEFSSKKAELLSRL
jgi:putative oligomerization/nucleic acid binding protein